MVYTDTIFMMSSAAPGFTRRPRSSSSLTRVPISPIDVALNVYSVAPVWHDEQPYYGLFVESSELSIDLANRIAHLLEGNLRKANIEYDSKRESARLGPIRAFLLPPGTWQKWDRERLKKTGGTLEQYKHPCLINDLQFKSQVLPD